jgi:hypothetical protein
MDFMGQISEDWEVVGRKSTHPILIGLLALVSEVATTPTKVIWIVRQRSTGIIKRVIAESESEAFDRIAQGLFEAD